MPIEIVPQSTDVAGGSNAALLKALKERRALQEMLAGDTRRSTGNAQAPAFAPSSMGQAAFGYAGVAANALGDRMVVEREKKAQADRLRAGAEALKATVPQFKGLPTETVMGLMLSDPELPSKLAQKQFEVSNREPKFHSAPPTHNVYTSGGPPQGGAAQPGAAAPGAAPAGFNLVQQGRPDPSEMRREWTGRTAYKNLSEARPMYEAMWKTAGTNSRASDLNLVYGLAKIFDPGSVVRNEEMIMVRNTASLPEWVVGQIHTLNGGAALTPETRKQVMREAHGRMSSYEDAYESEAKQWAEIAKRNKIAPEDVIIPFERSRPWEPQQQTHTPTPQPQLDPALMQEAIRRGLIPGPQAP